MWKYLISLGLNQLEAHPELLAKLIQLIVNHLAKHPEASLPSTAPPAPKA